ncbi:uracil-DNA glycosylase family protein [Methylobacterium brachythecii]|uniref:Uracil-DNA glycosylase-like domain-containing protein n=1 Tax=Methylobacterium brachythecii TaxID=1176177 RepID=A0A7W6ALI5_9HYPH|nr:uracil-DNA glycosylase family protein [Methylobacterium brachythecii]MBB3905663.1 hypothetical protein [Methylobacterium brachythecii]GLS46938.1 hypothetical protein GCM10007884_49380 [Methylobacterium brachythecii]
MTNSLFPTFAPLLRTLTTTELEAEIAQPRHLLIETGEARGKRIDVAYAPFDHVNLNADVVIVGLTPGRQQMRNALVAARRSLLNGRTEAQAAEDAKVFASFSGPMRSNLVAMLDSIGLNRTLDITTAGSLWAGDAYRVHFTSILRYPVFMDGTNYTGAPSPTAIPLLRTQLMKWFADEMKALPNAVFVPLGPVAGEAVDLVAAQVELDRRQVLSGLPHPSGANAERIAFFLGRKPRDQLSDKVNPEKLLAAREALTDKVSGLRARD